LEAARLIYLGKIPYRDFYFQYTPLTIWLGALWFKIFGVGILKLRWLALLISFATVIVGYFIARKIFSRSIVFLVTLGLIVWGFPQTNFLWPSSTALLFLFLVIYFLIKFTEEPKNLYLILSGISVAFSLLTKQNLGLAAFLGASVYILYLWLKKNKGFGFLWFFGGHLPVIMLVVLSLGINLKTTSGLREFFIRSLDVITGKSLFAPYPLFSGLEPGFSGLAKWFGKTFIYLFPLLLYIVSAFFCIRKRKQEDLWYLIFFLTGLYFFAMMWPLSDLVHLTFAVPAIIIMSAAFTLFKSKLWTKFAKISLIVLIFVGFYKTFFMKYYTFETPYLLQTREVSINGEKFYLDEKYSVIANRLSELKTSVFRGKAVFAHPYMPMFYYLIDQTAPTYELYTVDSLLSHPDQLRVIKELKEKNVDFVILETWREKNSQNLITKYIRDNYKKVDQVWDYDILEKI
jgi:4-amino-4-deoxy-L-arabinose transferase-like glycosyltransferase